MNKQEVMAKVALTEKDTGSPEVQVQLPRFLQTFCPLVFSDRHHVQYLSFLSLRYLCFYFSTAFGIILL